MSEIEGLEQAIAALETQRPVLGDAVVEAMLPQTQKHKDGRRVRPATGSQQHSRAMRYFLS